MFNLGDWLRKRLQDANNVNKVIASTIAPQQVKPAPAQTVSRPRPVQAVQPQPIQPKGNLLFGRGSITDSAQKFVGGIGDGATTLRAGFMAEGGIGDSILKFNAGAGEQVKNIRQAIPRAVKSYGLDARGQQTYAPKNAAEKWLYGEAPVKNSAGVGSDALGLVGLNQNPIANKAVGTVLNAFDVAPVGQAGSQLIKKGAPVVAKGAQAGAKATINAVDQAGIPKSSNLRVPLEDRRELSDFVDMQMKRYNPSADERNRLVARAYELGDKYGIDVRRGGAADVQDRVANYLDELNTGRAYAKQGGYAKVPFKEPGEADISPSALEYAQNTSKPQDIANETADYWYKHGKDTKGGQMIKTGDDQYKRISEHNQFYSDFYKQNKRAPSKADYQAEVTRQLENGGGSMVEPDQATAYQLVKVRSAENDALANASDAQYPVLPDLQVPRSVQQPQLQKSPRAQPVQKKTAGTVGNSRPPSPDSTVLTDRTYTQSTPVIDSEQYLKSMKQAQKAAQKGSLNLGDKVSDTKAKFIDDLAPIEDRLNKAIKSGSVVDPKDHITYQLDRSRRAEGIMNAYVQDNGLDKIIQNVPDTKAFDQYLIARHAKELDPEIRTGRNAANDAQLVRDLDATYAPYAQELYKYNQKLLDTSVEYGLISKETANQLKKRYPEYVPLNRIFNEDELTALHGGAGRADASISKQTVVQKIKGSNRAIASPLNSIIDKTRVIVEQGERNGAARMLASYKDLPGNPFNLKEIPQSETIGSRHTISFLDNGKKRTFEVDPEIAEAAKHMSREDIGMWGRIAAVPARVLRAGATGINTGFAGANVVKDVIGSAINSRHPFRIADPRNFGKALAAALNHNGKYYRELMREGVSGTSFDMYRNPLKSNVGEIRSQKNVATRALHNLKPNRWVRTLENTIGRSEDFGRALQYYSNKAGFKADGKSDDVARILAADQARHNATNFFRHGSIGKNVNLAIPYWNAGVQGARIQTRRIIERPAQTLGKIGLAIAAPSAMIAMNNYANPKNAEVMENIPDYEKEGNIIIVGPDARMNQETGEWEGVFKIPVPPQHIGIHKTIQDAVRAGLTGQEFDVVGNLGKVTENYTTVNPTSAKDVVNKYIPQALKLVAEPIANKNFFTGNTIVPEFQKNLPAADQYNEYTSGVARVAGELSNQSPRIIDNALRTGLGGAGQNLVNLLDSGLAAAGVIDQSGAKGKSIPDSVVGRFYGAKAINPADKAEKQFSELKKQVIESKEYKSASPYDKSRMLNRLETDLDKVAYNQAGKSEDKLTKKQSTLANDGFNVETYTNLGSKSKGSELPEKLKSDKKIQNIYRELDKMNTEETEAWRKSEANGNSKELIRQASSLLPNKEFPALPDNNGVAELYTKFLKAKESGKWSELRTQKEMGEFLRKSYETQFNDDEKFIRDLSDADMLDAASNGQISKETMDKIIAVDDILLELGMQAKVGKKARASMGYGGQPTTVRGSGGKKTKSASRAKGGRKTKKGKFDYKLFGFASQGQSNSKQLRELLKRATVKRGQTA